MNDASWREHKFEELAAESRNAIVGGPFGSNLVSSDYTEAGVPVIRGQNMGHGRWVTGQFAFVSDEKAESLRANWARPGDIVFTQRGTLGQVALVPDAPWGRYIVSQSQMKATINPDKADSLFIYYYFSSPIERQYVIANAIQTGVPHSNLGQLRAHPMRIPPPLEQRRIASVLGALDDKIEQNRRTARALERLARAVFRAWFVGFEPVKAKAAGASAFPSMPQPVFDALPASFVASDIGPVPQGWEIRAIAQVATFLNGLALQKYPPRGDGRDLRVIKIAQLRRGSTQGADWASCDVPAQYVVDDGDLLFSWSGTLEAELWFGGTGALNQHLFKVTSSQFPQWYCLHWIRQHLPWFRRVAASKATTMGHIKRGHLQEAQVIAPPALVMRAADQVIGPLYEMYAQVQLESRKLAQIRELLLPNLLSGAVRISQTGAGHAD
jgi:type I restriction enzyme S subunit